MQLSVLVVVIVVFNDLIFVVIVLVGDVILMQTMLVQSELF